ncbi:MAG: succinate dehydrogenase assembly factor 2 [Amphritea sp.]
MYTEEDVRRLKWQSRRGMLELDVLFTPFVDEVFRDLPEEDQDRFVKLLACEDTDLFVWMMEREVPTDPDFQRMVRMILDRVQPSAG